MRKTLALGAALVGATLAFAPAAMAASPKTFVSATGNDANTATNCSKNDPCRGFAAAFSVTNAGGQIVAIDTGVYGQLTITKAVTLMAAPGVTAEILVPSGQSGFTVSAGVSDVVILRNLTIFGTVGPTTGITHTSGKLIVENSTFNGLTTGINSSVSGGRSLLTSSRFYNNGTGLNVTLGRWTVAGTDFADNGDAIHATGDGGSTGNPPSGATMVRVHDGSITDNTVAFHMTNAGVKAGNCNGANIYVNNNGGNARTPNAVGNGTYALPDGSTETSGCVGIGQYTPGVAGTP